MPAGGITLALRDSTPDGYVMSDEASNESVNKRTKEDGKFLGIMAQEFPDTSFAKVLKAAEKTADSASVAAEVSDSEFTALIKNIGQRSSVEKVTTTLRTSAQGKGIFIAGAAIAAAVLSTTYLVHKLRQRKEAKQLAAIGLSPHMREADAPHHTSSGQTYRDAAQAHPPARAPEKSNALQNGLAEFAEQAGVDPGLVKAAKGIFSGEGLSLGDAAKAAAAFAASQGEGKGGDNPLAALGAIMGGQETSDNPLSKILGMLGGPNAERGR